MLPDRGCLSDSRAQCESQVTLMLWEDPYLDSRDLCSNFSNGCVPGGRLFNFSCSPFPHLETRGLDRLIRKVPNQLGSGDFTLHDISCEMSQHSFFLFFFF